MYAIVLSSENLQRRSEVVNSSRTDGTYFYVNGNSVSVSNPHYEMTSEQQKSELKWFLSDREFTISNN